MAISAPSAIDGQRQSDAEQPRWNRAFAAQNGDVDSRGVGEQDEGERRLCECADRLARGRVGHEVEDFRSAEHAQRDEDHRGRQRRAAQTPRNRGHARIAPATRMSVELNASLASGLDHRGANGRRKGPQEAGRRGLAALAHTPAPRSST
jgi:hypothetical protein